MDAYFIVDEKQQCLGEIKCENRQIKLEFVFSDSRGFAVSHFYAVPIDKTEPERKKYDEYVMIGIAKYYDDRCELTIKREDNQLWEMTQEAITLTFYEQPVIGPDGG